MSSLSSTSERPPLQSSSDTGSRGAMMGLADGFMEIFSYVQTFRQTAAQRQPAYDTFRGEIIRLLKQSEILPSKRGWTWEEYESARYALCAWIDESVMVVGWEHSGRWRAELLQHLYYRSSDAGEKFFERLKSMGAQQNAVREVYYLCLALGFEGRHQGPDGSALLIQLKDQQLRLLFDGADKTPTIESLQNAPLMADAESLPLQIPQRPSGFKQAFLTQAIIGGSTLVLVILYVIYRLSLHSLGTNILRAVGSR